MTHELSERDSAIVAAVKAGEARKRIAERFGLSANRIAQIVTLADFLAGEPELAAACSDREIFHAAFLWSRGFQITRKA